MEISLANPQAEAVTIGACLIEPDSILKLAQELSPEDFTVPIWRLAARALWSCYSRRTPPTLAAVMDVLAGMEAWSETPRSGRICYADLENAMRAVTDLDLAHLSDNARLVREMSLRREGQAWATSTARLFCDLSVPADEIQSRAYSELAQVSERAQGRDASLTTIGAEERERLASMAEGALPGLPCGLPWLDELTGGFMPGETWVIAAPYKMRKTSLMLNMVLASARAAGSVTIFTNGDTTREGTYRKLLALIMCDRMRARHELTAAVSSKTLQYPLSSPAYQAMRLECEAELEALPIRLYDARDRIGDLEECSRLLRRDFALHGARVFVYDYAQAIWSGKNDYERTSLFAGWLQRMAGEFGLTGIALSQLSEDAIRNSSGDSYSPGTKGGGALPAMANVLLETKYKEPHLTVKLKLARDARMGDSVTHRVNPESGLVLDSGVRSLP